MREAGRRGARGGGLEKLAEECLRDPWLSTMSMVYDTFVLQVASCQRFNASAAQIRVSAVPLSCLKAELFRGLRGPYQNAVTSDFSCHTVFTK